MASKKKTRSEVEPAALARGEPIRWLPLIALSGLLCIFAIRMTISETIYPSLSSQVGSYSVPEADRFNGPQAGTTLALSALTIALSAAAPLSRKLRRIDGVALGLIAIVVAISVFSTFNAANKFFALVGTFDLAAALLGGWAIGVFASSRRHRAIVIGMLIAILAAWVARGLVQHFVDNPETIALYKTKRLEILASMGIPPDGPEEFAFKSRMLSREIGGFIALSNVFASGLVGLITACGGILLATLAGKISARRGENRSADGEIPLLPTLGVCLAMGLIVALYCTWLTDSNGALATLPLCLIVLGAGVLAREWVARHARKIAIAAGACFVLGLVAVAGYGIARDTLPSKSMMFRWHYWSATAPMVRDHAALGVGLNNFGDYYGMYKRPSSPEDVKDPHSFFVRLAAELGVPAAIVAGALLVCYFAGAARRKNAAEVTEPDSAWPMLAAGGGICLVWCLARYALGDPQDTYFAMTSAFYGAFGFAFFAVAVGILTRLSNCGHAVVLASLLVGACGMLLYDQINMALVTGPVAALFWIMLATSASEDDETRAPRSAFSKLSGAAIAACGALALSIAIWQSKGTMPWDPGPHEAKYAYHTYISGPPGKPEFAANRKIALESLDAAIAVSPRDASLLAARIRTRFDLQMPVAEDLRRLFQLDRTTASIRYRWAIVETDLPVAERVKILNDALELDSKLPAGEAKHLTKEQIDAAKAYINLHSQKSV